MAGAEGVKIDRQTDSQRKEDKQTKTHLQMAGAEGGKIDRQTDSQRRGDKQTKTL